MDIYLTEAFVLFLRGSLSSPRTPFTSTINRLNSLTKHVTKDLTDQAVGSLKTYAAISNAHLSRVCKRGKLSGSCLSTFNGFGSTQLPIFLCHIGVPTFSSQNN